MYYRAPSGKRTHIVYSLNTTLTVCGISTRYGAKWKASDLPSGERSAFKTCERCRTVVGDSQIHPVYLAPECATCGEAIVSRVEKQNGKGTYVCTEGHVHTVNSTDVY